MSERGGGAGAFLLGVAVGAVLGLLFALGAGEETRAQLARRLRTVRDLAGDKADELRARLDGGDEEDEAAAEARSARRELERRLAEARERRRSRRVARRGARVVAEEEDEPLA